MDEPDIFIKFQEQLQAKNFFEFLINLTFDLTISARGTYPAEQAIVGRPKALMGINELNHRILSRALAMLDDSWTHTPEDFCQMIFSLAELYGCVDDLYVALNMSFERLNDAPTSH